MEEVELPVIEKKSKDKKKKKSEDEEGEEKSEEGEEKSEEDLASSEEEDTTASEEESEVADSSEETTAEDSDDMTTEIAEKEYKEVIVPHTFNVEEITETPIGARLLTKEQKKEALKRIKALDQRDKDKKMADEAKNAYESMIYSLRDWLRDDDNTVYVDESERDALFTKLEDGEEWLYDDGANL